MRHPQAAPHVVPTKLFLTQKEVIQLSTLSRRTIERLERTTPPGVPTPVRFGQRCKRYRTEAILAWLDGTWTPDEPKA